jgi:hypothetical protein
MVNVTLAEKYAIIGGLVLVVVLGSFSTFTSSAFAVCTKSGVCANVFGPFNIATAKHNAAGSCNGSCIFFGSDKSATSTPSHSTAQNGHTTVTSP